MEYDNKPYIAEVGEIQVLSADATFEMLQASGRRIDRLRHIALAAISVSAIALVVALITLLC